MGRLYERNPGVEAMQMHNGDNQPLNKDLHVDTVRYKSTELVRNVHGQGHALLLVVHYPPFKTCKTLTSRLSFVHHRRTQSSAIPPRPLPCLTSYLVVFFNLDCLPRSAHTLQ